MYKIILSMCAWLIYHILFSQSVFALPSSTDTKIVWDNYTDSRVQSSGGFYVYWCDPNVSSCTDVDFTDEKKIDIGFPSVNQSTQKHEVVVLSFLPNAFHELCFRMTAYLIKSDGVKVESTFSNQACGFFGIPAVGNVEVQ